MTAHARRPATISQRLKESWHEFKRSKPGHRFQDRYRRRRNQGHSLIAKALSLLTGFVLFVLGLVLLPAPGPGFLVIFVGAGMIAEESKIAARGLDWLELRLHRFASRRLKYWRSASLVEKALVVVIALFAAAVFALLGGALFFDL